jgi:hypothetical protein
VRFLHYQSEFLKKRLALGLEVGDFKSWLQLDPPRRLDKPRWRLDWAVLFTNDNMFFRVREDYEPYSFPRVSEAYRSVFTFHYGPNTVTGFGGRPRTEHNADTIIRIDKDETTGPHLCYARRNHILQEHVSNFIIEKTELFDFLEAVKTVRESKCTFEEFLLFKIDWPAVKSCVK